MRLARFYRYFARNRMTPDVASLYINLFHSLSPFPQLSLWGWYCRTKKRVRVTAHYACVNVHNSRTISWSVINNDLSHLGGYIYSIGLVGQSSFGIVAGSCPCIKFVNAGDLE